MIQLCAYKKEAFFKIKLIFLLKIMQVAKTVGQGAINTLAPISEAQGVGAFMLEIWKNIKNLKILHIDPLFRGVKSSVNDNLLIPIKSMFTEKNKDIFYIRDPNFFKVVNEYYNLNTGGKKRSTDAHIYVTPDQKIIRITKNNPPNISIIYEGGQFITPKKIEGGEILSKREYYLAPDEYFNKFRPEIKGAFENLYGANMDNFEEFDNLIRKGVQAENLINDEHFDSYDTTTKGKIIENKEKLLRNLKGLEQTEWNSFISKQMQNAILIQL